MFHSDSNLNHTGVKHKSSQKVNSGRQAECRFIKQLNILSWRLVTSNKRLPVIIGAEYIWILLFGPLISELLHWSKLK